MIKRSSARGYPLRALTLVIILLATTFLACAHSTFYASVPVVQPNLGWKVTETTHNLLHRETGVEFGFAPLNQPANTASEFFVWVDTNQRNGVNVKIELDGIRLIYQGKIFIGDGWKCSLPVRPIATERLPQLDSRRSGTCGLIRFRVAPPRVDEEFTLTVEEASVDGKVIRIPEIRFVKGIVSFRGGFI